METNNTATRKNSRSIRVYCLPQDYAEIEAKAKAARLSLSKYLLNVGLGSQIYALDREQLRELVRVNGDLGRLGGLLKLWLTDDVRTAQVGALTIRAVLSRVEANQELMAAVMQKLTVPGK